MLNPILETNGQPCTTQQSRIGARQAAEFGAGRDRRYAEFSRHREMVSESRWLPLQGGTFPAALRAIDCAHEADGRSLRRFASRSFSTPALDLGRRYTFKVRYERHSDTQTRAVAERGTIYFLPRGMWGTRVASLACDNSDQNPSVQPRTQVRAMHKRDSIKIPSKKRKYPNQNLRLRG